MGRRSDHSKEELKAMAIKAAKEIVIKEGMQELSTRKVAKEMGYTVGTIYNIFKNLDDLVIHVNSTTVDDLYNFIIENSKNSSNEIQAIVMAYFNFSKEHFNQWSLIFKYQMRADTIIPEWYIQKAQKLFEPAFNVLKRETKLDISEIPDCTRVIWAGVHGISTLYHSGKLNIVQAKSVEALIVNFVSTYMNGLSTR